MNRALKRRTTVVRAAWIVLAAVLVVSGVVAERLYGQRRGGFRGIYQDPNAPYDGRFTFVRLSYQVYNRSGWEFDYPAMERNFMTIINDLSTLHPHVRESNIHSMDDPILSKYPVAYLSEPGWWIPDQLEAEGLRKWLKKGGFLIVDDFFGSQWDNFERSMLAVLPGAKIVRLEVTNPIFNSFFKLKTLEGMYHPDNPGVYPAEYYGIYEDNDPNKRLMVVIDYNNDIGDYMEWSGTGFYQINFSNDAYKIATNYVIYALTH
ncbi:MAG: DUF4159 domain-containing protein [Gemmatimonadaceae bacterium]